MNLIKLALALGCFFSLSVHAAIKEEIVEYKEGDTVLEGFIAYPERGKRPAVVIVHEWNGLGDYVKRRARQVAGLGYVAFAADIYGKGVRPKTPEESQKLASIYKQDRALMRRRAQAAFDKVASRRNVDTKRIAAMGYCFGGTVALELARAGAPLAGVVSFHGGLNTPDPSATKALAPKILVLHGADDPAVPSSEVEAFELEMRGAGADWQLVKYGGTVHAFTNPEVKGAPGAAAAYNEQSDKRSWVAMKDFFKEIFAK